jgi:tryptophanyl-tRNA synthetase
MAPGPSTGSKDRVVVSGARPTGRQHLGNYHGALKNWLRLQDEARCLFFVADWHALTTDYAEPGAIRGNTVEMVLDWLAVGLDPERSTLFLQSAIKEHAELFVFLAMLTPVPWLERTPTYKEQREQIQDRDLSTFGFLGYPLLQAADVLIYKAAAVPVGIDQAPHIELTREIARRFNATYRPLFPEPATVLTESPKIVGTDGRKMSKSYGNAIYLTDSPEEIDAKLSRMITDPRRARRTDPGEPQDCPAYLSFHRLYCTPEELRYQEEGCRTASIGCLECKRITIKHVQAELEPIRARRAGLGASDARAALAAGNERARSVAAGTMAEVREAVGLA